MSGRGLSIDEARHFCLLEGIERSAAIYDPDLSLIKASYADLSDDAVDPASMLLFSSCQYDTRKEWNKANDKDHHWPPPINPDQKLDWLDARHLGTRKKKLIPAAICLLGYPDPLPQGLPVPDSSGLAAGSDLEDATLRGLLELVERDAVSIWWYNQIRRPQLALNLDRIPVLSHFQDWVHGNERQFWLLDLTHDLGTPVAAAITCNNIGSDYSIGFGSALSAEEAAISAAGELVQFEITKQLRNKSANRTQDDLISLVGKLDKSSAAFLWPSKEVDPQTQQKCKNGDDLLKALTAKNLHPFVLDFSQHNHFVVRVVAPGLRPIWPRFGEGRLFDVPLELGWLLEKNVEQTLNRMPLLY